ncbi:ATP-dependent Clp protease proteolytic subunit [Patescibacteria group bacterium]|nr:ATP-dependent Clp protease proteolytic subunit [Patescibacteria group bacterium]
MLFTIEDTFDLVLLGEIIKGDFKKLIQMFPSVRDKHIFFCSNGGRLVEASKIHQYLYGKNISITAGEKIDSSAMIIFLAPDVNDRYAKKYTQFTFHNPIFENGTTAEQQEQRNNFATLVAHKTNLSIEGVFELMNNEVVLNSDEALSYGIISKIIE